MQHTGAVERFDEIGRQLENNLERLTSRADGLEKESVRTDETFTANQKQANDLAETLEFEEKKLVELNGEKDALLAATADSRNTLHKAEAELQALHEEHSAKRHRLSTLLELEEKRAVYTPQTQKLFAEEKNIGVNLAGVLADRLNVTREAETAVETLFGDFLEAVVVESLDDAKRLSTWLKANDIGRTAMIILPKTATRENDTVLGMSDTIADHLGVSGELADALRQVFPREMSARLVKDLDQQDAAVGNVLINYDGDMLLGGRMFVAGNRKSTGTNESLLAFKRELNQLEKTVHIFLQRSKQQPPWPTLPARVWSKTKVKRSISNLSSSRSIAASMACRFSFTPPAKRSKEQNAIARSLLTRQDKLSQRSPS